MFLGHFLDFARMWPCVATTCDMHGFSLRKLSCTQNSPGWPDAWFRIWFCYCSGNIQFCYSL